MKSTAYTLTTPIEQAELEKVLEQLDVEKLDPGVREEAMIHAGLDRYVSGIGFFRLKAPFRGHAKDSLVVRHINSGGVQATVCETQGTAPAPLAASSPTSTKTPDQEAAAAAAAAAELDAKRAQQVAADTAANENKEAPATPAAATNG